mmetsp:Transcript_18150/g.31845  ORF Transcript_18150/g.31845 Transcript_18150/m.31845 type:complete len:267 (+) Transcript_18150:127-927(+)
MMRVTGAILAVGVHLLGVNSEQIDTAALATDTECADTDQCALRLVQLKGQKDSTDGQSGESSGSETQPGGYACPMVPYTGPPHGAASCFCHKAQNPTCRDKACTCREGCEDVAVQSHRETVTFLNEKKARHCKSTVAMLTIPRPYFKHIGKMKHDCGSGSQQLLETMFISGATAYEKQTGDSGPVMQCIHKPGHVSVGWLHLHTFCPSGNVDGMPNRHVAFCKVMQSKADAPNVAAAFLKWLAKDQAFLKQGNPELGPEKLGRSRR